MTHSTYRDPQPQSDFAAAVMRATHIWREIINQREDLRPEAAGHLVCADRMWLFCYIEMPAGPLYLSIMGLGKPPEEEDAAGLVTAKIPILIFKQPKPFEALVATLLAEGLLRPELEQELRDGFQGKELRPERMEAHMCFAEAAICFREEVQADEAAHQKIQQN